MNIKNYLEYIDTPWGELFYKLVWNHLQFHDLKILDFGSGFGATANHLSENNTVIAIEPNELLAKNRLKENQYTQIIGSIEELKNFGDLSFDVILCHNVLEYMDDREELLGEFFRLLKDDGILSIVKHNKLGKIMHKAVFEFNTDEVKKLLQGDNTESVNFGLIREYGLDDLRSLIKEKFDITDIFGIRTFFGIQHNSFKNEPDWVEKMYELECSVESIRDFYNIAFFQHLLLKKCCF